MTAVPGLPLEHRLLLDAAFGEPSTALTAWGRWLDAAGTKDPDLATRTLAPLVHANLVPHGLTHPLLVMFKGLYRHSWYNNQQLLKRVAILEANLERATIPVMLLDEFPLAITAYRDGGLRPVQAIDLLVRSDDEANAIEVLRHDGWQVQAASVPQNSRWRTIVRLRHADGTALALHTALFGEARGGARTSEAWERICPLELAGGEAAALSPTDQLFELLVHEARSERLPAAIRIADALMLLRNRAGEIDTDLLWSIARRLQAELLLSRSIGALEQIHPLPAAIFQQPTPHGPSRNERLELVLGRIAPRSRTAISQMVRAAPVGPFGAATAVAFVAQRFGWRGAAALAMSPVRLLKHKVRAALPRGGSSPAA